MIKNKFVELNEGYFDKEEEDGCNNVNSIVKVKKKWILANIYRRSEIKLIDINIKMLIKTIENPTRNKFIK